MKCLKCFSICSKLNESWIDQEVGLTVPAPLSWYLVVNLSLIQLPALACLSRCKNHQVVRGS